MKYYLVAGEASGDLHAANLMQAIKNQDTDADFRYFGGDKMKAQGGVLVKHYHEMAFMGFVEVILHLKTIFKNIKYCKSDILAYQPDVVILVDFPGFNLKIAEFTKKNNFKTFYYIAPKVWAWNTKRVFKIKRIVDHLFCILPFEIDFFNRYDVPATYVGNPLLDEIATFEINPNFKVENELYPQKIIALLPGSRVQEIDRILPAMLKMVNEFPDYQFVIAGTPDFPIAYYQKYIQEKQVKIVFNQTYDLLSVAEVALVASGTATLETALFHVPQIVMYIGHPITIYLSRKVIKIKFISLVNLMVNRLLVKELIQNECNPENLKTELLHLFESPNNAKIKEGYTQITELMGKAGASEKAARLMLKILKNQSS